MAKGFADVSEIIGCMPHSCNTSPGDTASPTFILFNTTGTESKGYVNHTKIMEPDPAENPTKQLWQLNHIRGIYSLSSAFVFPKGDAQICNTRGYLRPRLCENYFQKLNVVIRKSFIAVFA